MSIDPQIAKYFLIAALFFLLGYGAGVASINR